MVHVDRSPQRRRLAAAAFKPLLLGGLAFTALALSFDLPGLGLRTKKTAAPDTCEAIVQAEARLTRPQLAELLTIPERDTKERVRQVVAEPFCRLPTLQVRSGVAAEREAYPLEFDPATRIVILYENDEYAGYRFSFE